MDHNADVNRNREELGDELMHGFAGRLIRQKVRRICRVLHLTSADEEDLEQQLRLELVRRAARFDPQRGTWAAFVACVTDSRARTHFRRLQRLPRPYPFSDLDISPETFVHITEDSEAVDRKNDLQYLREQLDVPGQELLAMLRHQTVSEVARYLRIPRSTLSDRVRSLQRPLAELDPHAETQKIEKLP